MVVTQTDDLILPFQIADSAVRGRVVRLGSSIDEILGAHAFETGVSEIVGEATALVAMMGSSLKFEGRLILQAQGDGPVPMLVADYSADGSLRATATLRPQGAALGRGLQAMIGRGHIALTIDQGPEMERYQGVAPLEGKVLEDAAVAYFRQSEQIPTAVRLAVGRVRRPGQPESWRAGGIIAQFMPAEGGGRARGESFLRSAEDEAVWERAAVFLRSTRADELLDPDLGPETLLFRLFHEDGVRVFDPKPVKAACSCAAAKITPVLRQYSPQELDDMAEGDGFIRVSCEFCRVTYRFTTAGVEVVP